MPAAPWRLFQLRLLRGLTGLLLLRSSLPPRASRSAAALEHGKLMDPSGPCHVHGLLLLILVAIAILHLLLRA